jgi:GNAT superfamily N-acetyltransferase
MAIEIRQETAAVLGEYASIPISFWVKSRLRVQNSVLEEEPVDRAYLKDWESPLNWAKERDLGGCGIFIARDGARLVGGAMVDKNAGEDVATLVDLRVAPDRRRQGIGRLLFERALTWTRDQKLRAIRIETQNNNVGACRFYARCGAGLITVVPNAYAQLPDEVMLVWEITSV